MADALPKSDKPQSPENKHKSKHKSFPSVDAAVKHLIKVKGISILSYPGLFRKGINLSDKAKEVEKKERYGSPKRLRLVLAR